jgi:hypothetical protein
MTDQIGRTSVRHDTRSGETCWVVPSDLVESFPLGARVRYRLGADRQLLVDVIGEDVILGADEYEGRVIPIEEDA